MELPLKGGMSANGFYQTMLTIKVEKSEKEERNQCVNHLREIPSRCLFSQPISHYLVNMCERSIEGCEECDTVLTYQAISLNTLCRL